MKYLKYLLFAGVFFAAGWLLPKGPSFEQRLEGYRLGAEWGCYMGVLFSSDSIKSELLQWKVREESLTYCVKVGEFHKEFIKTGGKHEKR